MLEIKFLGGASEVGRSAFLVDTGVEKFLLDYGLNAHSFSFPLPPPLELDAVFVSHAHLDHCGMLPELYRRGYLKETFGTKTTLQLSDLLIRDSINIQARKGIAPLYLKSDLVKLEDNSKSLNFKQPLEFAKSVVEFRDAGHIPGSATTLIDSGTKRLLYTGDLKYLPTDLMNGADRDFIDIDALMIDSTYSYANHPDRDLLTKNLKEEVKRIIENEGTVLLPSFAIGRTQEMLLVLSEMKIPIYLDGMGIEATRIILDNPTSIRDPEKLKKAFGRAHKIEEPEDRKKVLEQPSIVIASAGMLQGGPMHYYLRKLYKKENSLIIFNGYQAEGTSGKTLLEKHRFISGATDMDVKMQVKYMDFSAHIGRDNIFKFIEKVNPKKIIPVHGSHIPDFVAELKDKGFDAIAVQNGDTVKI